MKKASLYIISGLLLTACQNEESSAKDQGHAVERETHLQEENNTGNDNEQLKEWTELNTLPVEGYEGVYISVSELADGLGGHYEYDPINKDLLLEIADRQYYLVYGVPVIEINGEYFPADKPPFVENDNREPYLSIEFIDEGLETDYTHNKEENNIAINWDGRVIEAWRPAGENDVDIHSYSVEEMVDFLAFLHSPIEGASVSTVESHLPGAPRGYRNGIHEGIDWYGYASGTEITTDTPVYGMAKGKVVRVDSDFEDYNSHVERNIDLKIAAKQGFTPQYILDRLRGMQVWVQYDNGVMIRFAHLDSIPEDVEAGQTIDSETIIGYVGNTGTSGAMNQDGSGLHLHKDLLVKGELFWEPFTLEETAYIIEELWH
ncbi:peptidoglycan DD-metalloendopeptidase family protein [Salipaludibacillus aurantiacus]|uniref:Copper amine oxidase N-terminal domain-containing protein n=1 Tax=Salipaludibacillus aurantiacus TaxID=1601833 RepID=A0A1H9WZZ3_9BACI|nr:peptidoglycan DD-metalloendopeptidase family protein [Salipaludibacillus aurantiacus]SES39476.1 Copper amine oxidase N-terminal domain-containing protein [Salipaludibacillus aurantiacus]